MLPGEQRLSRGICSGIRGICVASSIGIKRKFLGRGYPKGVGYSREGAVVWGALALYMHIKFEVSSLSHSRDTRVRQNHRQTDRHHNWIAYYLLRLYKREDWRRHKNPKIAKMAQNKKIYWGWVGFKN